MRSMATDNRSTHSLMAVLPCAPEITAYKMIASSERCWWRSPRFARGSSMACKRKQRLRNSVIQDHRLYLQSWQCRVRRSSRQNSLSLWVQGVHPDSLVLAVCGVGVVGLGKASGVSQLGPVGCAITSARKAAGVDEGLCQYEPMPMYE